MSKAKEVEIASLKRNLFVRTSLNQDHVLLLAEHLDAGEDLGPILISPDNEVVDGRHRTEAYELLDRTTIPARVVDTANRAELISMAYKANTGGSLPPTKADTEHTVSALLEAGATKKSIGEMLGLPASLARKYINSVEGRLKRAKLNRAAMAVAEGKVTAVEAARENDVDLDQLRQIIAGGKRRRKQSGVDEIKRAMSASYRSISSKNSNMLRSVLEKLADGDLAPKLVSEVFSHIEKLQRNGIKAIAGWKARFQAMVNGGDKQ